MRDELKKQAAERAAGFVREGDTVGLGTGSTARYAVLEIGRRVKEGLGIRGVPTSEDTRSLARELGIPLVELNEVDSIDITIDGADQVDPGFNLIKGGGGALTREKLVAVATRREVIVVDDTKLVPVLGGDFPVPVEVLPFAWRHSGRKLESLGCQPRLRTRSGETFVSDNGNYILDCTFERIEDPAGLEKQIKQISGVVESGLFVGIAATVVIGASGGIEVKERP